MNAPLLERRQQPSAAHVEPLTADELQALVDRSIELHGGMLSFERPDSRAAAESARRRERRACRWRLVIDLVGLAACAAALFQPTWPLQ